MLPQAVVVCARLMPNESPQRVIVLCLSGLGDAILSSPAIAALATVPTRYQLTLLTMFKATLEYLQAQEFTEDVRFMPFLGMTKAGILRRALQLRHERFDVSVVPYGMNRLGYNLLSYAIGARQRIGFAYQRQSVYNLPRLNQTVLREEPNLHAVEENLRWAGHLLGTEPQQLSAPLRYRVPASAEAVATEFLASRGLDHARLLGIHAGCNVLKNQQSRLWPAARFAELICQLAASDPDLRFLLFQGPQDAAINRVIVDGLGVERDRTALVESQTMLVTAALMRRCVLFLSNDSGLMHTAAAGGIRCVSIFGPTNPVWVRPWHTQATVISRHLPCSPCFYYSSRPLHCVAGLDYACVRDLPVTVVERAVRGML